MNDPFIDVWEARTLQAFCGRGVFVSGFWGFVVVLLVCLFVIRVFWLCFCFPDYKVSFVFHFLFVLLYFHDRTRRSHCGRQTLVG